MDTTDHEEHQVVPAVVKKIYRSLRKTPTREINHSEHREYTAGYLRARRARRG